MGLLRGFFTVSGLTVVSRVLGVFRETILAYFLGASDEMDAFSTAYRFPSFFRRFFAEGGFQSVFIPYYSDFFVPGKLRGAGYFASKVFTFIFWAMLIVTILVLVFAREFTLLMAPGFASIPEKLELATKFTRIIFPSIAFTSLSSVYSGALISRKMFFAFATAPILVNFILIGSLLIFTDSTRAGTRISYGVLAAGIFLFAYYCVCARRQKLPSIRLSSIKLTFKTREFLRKITPILAGAGVNQVNVLTGSLFASFLPTGCITYLYCADRIVQLPIALFGISMGIVLLPELAESISRKNEESFEVSQKKAILFAARTTLPFVAILFVLSGVMVSFLYGYGKFTNEAIVHTSQALRIMTIGLPAYVLSKIIASIFFAKKDTKLPMKAAIMSMLANIIFSAILLVPLKEKGIATANAIAGFVNVFVMCRGLNVARYIDSKLLKDLVKIMIATIVMWAGMAPLVDHHGTYGLVRELIVIMEVGAVGGALYFIVLYLLGDESIRSLYHTIREKLGNVKG